MPCFPVTILMRLVLIEADRIMRIFKKELVVTSALDGEHSPGSLHYYGFALDFRTRHLDDDEKVKFHDELSYRLTSNYRCILEYTHLHVEYRGKLK